MRKWIDLLENDEASAFAELDRYTEWAGKKMNRSAVEWLKAHFPSKQPLTLYRGLTIEKSDIEKVTKHRPTLQSLDEVCVKWYGAASTDLIPGSACVLKRGSMSSWTHSLDVANEFAATPHSYHGGVYAQIVVEATIPADKIICDLATLPDHYQHRYPHQKEVIVSSGLFAGTVVSSVFRQWFPHGEPGYQWGGLKSHA